MTTEHPHDAPGPPRPGGTRRPHDQPAGREPADDSGAILLFDGVCNLCNGLVQWLIEHDTDARLRFASLQSEPARSLLATHLPAHGSTDPPESVVLIDEGGAHLRSEAVIRVARLLGPPFSLLDAARVLPSAFRDLLYRWIARNRYRWFGRRDACMTPTPELAERFLDGGGEP